MGVFSRIFSSDVRRALAAEAAGDLDSAAQHYVLANKFESAFKIYLLIAKRADDRQREIDALQNAFHFAPGAHLKMRASSLLGNALLARAEAEKIATPDDHKRVRDACSYLLLGGDYQSAGDAYLMIGDVAQATEAYRAGGLVETMEDLLLASGEAEESERLDFEGAKEFQNLLRLGQRTQAIAILQNLSNTSDNATKYKRELERLLARRITQGALTLKISTSYQVRCCSKTEVVLGRDPLADIVLRSAGVSRQHAKILVAQSQFKVRDLGSRNGLWLGDTKVSKEMNVSEKSVIRLGDHCTLQVSLTKEALVLRGNSGPETGLQVLFFQSGIAVPLSPVGVDAELSFDEGRPSLKVPEGGLHLGEQPIANGSIELISGDVLRFPDGQSVEVLT